MNIHSVGTVTPLRPADTTRADKHAAILRAAIDVFAERGFFTAQVADVARAAGVAAGTVYLYFRSKDDLLVSIFERTMKAAIADGRACIAPLHDPVEQLRAIARVHLGRMGRDRSLAVVFQVELRQSTKFMERFSSTLLREYLGIIRGIIVQGQASGAFRTGVNPTLAAKLFFGGLDEMATNWVLSRRKYSLAGEAAAIVDVFVGGVSERAVASEPRERRARERVGESEERSPSEERTRRAQHVEEIRERAQRREPRERRAPSKRRGRERVGESEGRSPSDKTTRRAKK